MIVFNSGNLVYGNKPSIMKAHLLAQSKWSLGLHIFSNYFVILGLILALKNQKLNPTSPSPLKILIVDQRVQV
jgi:hypothetical protein